MTPPFGSYAIAAELILERVVLVENHAADGGGLAAVNDTQTRLSAVVIRGNTASGMGGGM